MISRTPRTKRGGGHKSAGRRTAASGGAPAQSRRKHGNPGFSGYEYQIEVTVWVALDLMLAKAVTDEVVIEPRSEEDLEAAVKDPAVASLELTALGARLDLILQAKTRSGSPWSTTAIADVLLGKDANAADQGGRRSRPLAMLQDEMQRRYVFVTNEASAEGLRPHEGAHLFDFPEVDELPPHARAGYDKAAQASLAPRIVLLTGVTREVLAARIGALLTQHGHVPISKHNDCARDLREAVRQRIAGAHDGRWTRSDVMEVLVRYGGSLAPTRDMDRYVRPKSFDTIKAQLDKAHAVVIAGPSGTGKTLTADILELDLRNGPPVFDVIGEENGPGFIRRNLTRADPVLFHLRDPWGGNRLTPGADRWSGELPKLLDNAGPGRKFLITSRSDVLQSAGHELMKALQPYVVSIEVEDYGRKRLAEIYDGIAADLGDHARRLATQHRDRALKELTRPYEVKRFLVALSREDSQKPRKIEEVLADSQIEAIAKVIADQIAPFGADGAEAAAVIWALLSARGAVARHVFVKLGRRLRSSDPNLRPDIDGLIDFLVAGQNLRQDGVALAFYHPRVEDGLRLTFMSLPRDAERTLSMTVDVLLAWDRAGEDWGLETGLNVLRASAKVEELELNLSPITTQRLDQHLEAVALSAEKRADFERALRDLERFGSEDHPPARLARILIEGGLETEAVVFRKGWRAPDLVDEDISALREDSRTQTMIERFIREVLPFSDRDYHSELIPLLDRLATDLGDAFWDALDSIAGPGGPHNNIDVIVAGALAGAAPDYERAIARFARSEAETDAWLEGYAKDLYEAEEHAIDADAADHVIEEPSEQYFNAREGMKMVTRLRRARDGVTWIAGHPHRRSLLNALGDLIAQSHRAPPIAELEFLLAQADDWVRDQAWRAAEQHWDDSLSAALIEALARSDVDSTGQRGKLVEIAARHAGGNPVPDLIAASQHAPFARRLEMVYDLFRTKLDDDPKREDGAAARRARAERLVQSFMGAERSVGQTLLDVLAGDDIRAVARSLSDEDRSLLTATLASASIDLTGPLACLAAAAGLNVDEAASRLLSADDAADGELGIQAMLIAGGPNVRVKLEDALGHKRYDVRRRALRVLADDATAPERVRLIATAGDHSADVRLAFAVLMEEHRWPEAVDALVTLLGDTRNFASQLTVGSWSKFSVARAAARALGAYEDLPGTAIDALLDAAQAEGPDPFVACAALSALANRDDTRVIPAMEWALESAGLDRSRSHRPRAQAAAWALCDRATSGQSDMLTPDVVRLAERDVAAVAGPLLVAIGVHPGAMRDALLKRLRASGQHGRERLVRTAALAGDAATGMALDGREQTLCRLARGEALDSLSPTDRAAVEAWSRGLNLGSGFERFIAWIAELVFKLPLNGDLGNIRAFVLPERIGVLTMRSMTPYREEDGGGVDEGA
ncbi:nSTAND3 domain-containing NTPase [Xanthobacter sediminis]|uniref:nSTAND3 domain-containing NTPase n=1 Tax=Xanthobacter sediminis TaxID=3119926 RepID=UPI003728FC53